jgi:hypothetical protein
VTGVNLKAFKGIIQPKCKFRNEVINKKEWKMGIRMLKSRITRWSGHVARMGRRRRHIRFWWES